MEKKKISRAVLKTELAVAVEEIEVANYGAAKNIIMQILERVMEYDLK